MLLSAKSVNSSSFSYSIFTTPEQSIEIHKKKFHKPKRVICKVIYVKYVKFELGLHIEKIHNDKQYNTYFC